MATQIPPINWTFSQTQSPPAILRLEYKLKSTGEQKKVDLVSTDTSKTYSTYLPFSYDSIVEQYPEETKPGGDLTGRVITKYQQQTTDILHKKTEIKLSTQAAVAQNYVVDRLSRGAGLPRGGAITKTETEYEYRPTSDGPFLFKETVRTYISMAELAGGLDIPTYEWYDPGVALFLSTQKEIAYYRQIDESNRWERNTELGTQNFSSFKRESTRTETSTWIANGLRDFGKQGFAEAMKGLKAIAMDPEKSNELISTMVEYMTELVFEGTEVQIEIGKAEFGFEAKKLERPRVEEPPETNPGPGLGPGPDPENPYDPTEPPIENNPRQLRDSPNSEISQPQEVDNKKCFKGVIQFENKPYDSADETQTANYEMPFAPDDYLFVHGNKRKLIRGNARAAAEEYAKTESLMDIGHSFGQNIVTSFDDIPTHELSPVYVRLANVEGAFLTDALSYAWDSNGLVVSSDLMLIGVTGYYGSAPPAASWLRLPVPSLGLAKASNPILDTGVKANSIAIPSNFNPLDIDPVLAALPKNGTDTFAVRHNSAHVVGPVLWREQYVIGVRAGITTANYPYALVLPTEFLTADIQLGAELVITSTNLNIGSNWTSGSTFSAAAGTAGPGHGGGKKWVSESVFSTGGASGGLVLATGANWTSGSVFTAGTGDDGLELAPGATWTSGSTFSAGAGDDGLELAPGATWTSASAFIAGAGDDGIELASGASWTSGSVFTAGSGSNGIVLGSGAIWTSSSALTAGIGSDGIVRGAGATWTSGSTFVAGIGSDGIVRGAGATWTSSSSFTAGAGSDELEQAPGALWTSGSVFTAGTGRIEDSNGAGTAWTSSSVFTPGAGVIFDPALGDADFDKVVLLLHMDGENNSTTFIDSSSYTRTITVVGDAKISTAQSNFGGASALFDNSGDRLTVSIPAGLGAEAFTVEFFLYRTSAANYVPVFNSRSTGTGEDGIDIFTDGRVSTSGNWIFGDQPVPDSILPVGSMAHVAITRTAFGVMKRWFNGVQFGPSSIVRNNFSGTLMQIGGSGTFNTGSANGFVDELRITVGLDRYTSSFVPPLAPFPNIGIPIAYDYSIASVNLDLSANAILSTHGNSIALSAEASPGIGLTVASIVMDFSVNPVGSSHGGSAILSAEASISLSGSIAEITLSI